jgi:hypothetical protein
MPSDPAGVETIGPILLSFDAKTFACGGLKLRIVRDYCFYLGRVNPYCDSRLTISGLRM